MHADACMRAPPARQWRLLVLDEGHVLKNSQTEISLTGVTVCNGV